jgi:hypothetical protein
VDWQVYKKLLPVYKFIYYQLRKIMKTLFKLVIGSILASTILINFGSIATADQIRKVGVVAVIYDANNNISGLASSIAIGKNAAAGTASIVGNEAATSAVGGGGGKLTVTNPNTTNVGYSFQAESASNLGTISTVPSLSQKDRVDTKNPQPITIIP